MGWFLNREKREGDKEGSTIHLLFCFCPTKRRLTCLMVSFRFQLTAVQKAAPPRAWLFGVLAQPHGPVPREIRRVRGSDVFSAGSRGIETTNQGFPDLGGVGSRETKRKNTILGVTYFDSDPKQGLFQWGGMSFC